MHDGGTIIADSEIVASFTSGVLVLGTCGLLDIVPVDGDVLVPVPPLLRVHHSQHMHQLVEDPSLPVAPGAVSQLVGTLESYFCKALNSNSG